LNIKSLTVPLSRLSLSARILIGLALGVFVGLFFGESAAVLEPVAEIYIRLMQVTVLPYLILALVIGFGQLDAGLAKRLALRGGALVLVSCLLACVVIAAMPATFPVVENATFFSHSLVEPRQPFSLPDLFFTANPFHSLSNSVVPAVVVFSSMVGIALIGLEHKERALSVLRVLSDSVAAITMFVAGLTPAGVFAIGAVTAGTMAPDVLQQLEVYFVAFTAASLLLGFWILPLFVTAVTPFRYREVVGIARDALLTAFVANNAFIVLPILTQRSKDLLRKRGLANQESDSAAEILVPIFFNFPNAGRLLTLLFVPFAGWLAGSPLSAIDYPTLFAVGVPSYFAKAQVALPFLLDVFGMPHDLFQLYIPTTIITGKFDSMVAAMNLLVFALLGAAAMGGSLVLRRRRLLMAGMAMALGTLVVVLGSRLLLAATVDTDYRKDDALRQMHARRGLSAAVVRHDAPAAGEAVPPGVSALDRIRRRGVLRVGCDPGHVPFSFFNIDGELVGFDVELAQELANALGVTAEFVPIASWGDVPRLLTAGVIDVMPGLWYRPFWFSTARLSEPYVTGTVGLVVRDQRRHEFSSIESLRRSQGLRVGVPLDARQLASSMERYFGGAEVEFVPLESAAAFLDGRAEVDAFLTLAEAGAAASLLHPRFTVVVPQPNPVKLPIAFGVGLHADDLVDAVNEWVTFATTEGAVERAYDYWVLGQGARDTRPRWSILRDVLGWRTATTSR
jgi:Na+/H+-dicarboxylate symporter